MSVLIMSGSALSAKVVTISTAKDYNRHYNSDKPMITMYSSDGCGPCKNMKPHFHEAAEAATDMTFAVVDTAAKGLSGIVKGIRSLPTVIFSHKGKRVNQPVVGSRTRRQLDRHINEFRTTMTKNPKNPARTTRKRVITSPNPRPQKKQKTTAQPVKKAPAKRTKK